MSNTSFTLNKNGFYNTNALPEFLAEEREWGGDYRTAILNLLDYRSRAIGLGKGNRAERRIHAIQHAKICAGDFSEICD